MTRFSVNKRIRSFGYAFKGILHMFKSEHNSWIHLLAAVCAVCLGVIFEISLLEWCAIVFAIGIVFIAELFNTSIEELTDLVSPDQNEKAGKTKDIAAGAVLIAAFTAAVVGLIIFVPKFF